MASKLLLCASNFHVSAALWSGRRLIGCRGYADDEHGHAAFENLLRSAANVPVYLMADTVDEDYRFETLPHASGGDRREMLERKLKQLYRSTPFFGAELQHRESDKRRDDRYLFAALTNPETFTPWLQFLLAANVPVAGVYPLPMVSLGLFARLGLQDPNVLLVSRHAAGVRQTFLKDGRFRISRLTPARAGDQEAEDYYAEEIRNTRMYLDALNVTHVEELVSVVVLDADGSLGSLGDRVARGRSNLRAVRLGPDQIVAKVGVDRASLRSNVDALHLHLLGLDAPRLNLAPPTLMVGHVRYRARRSLYAASALAAVIGLGWSGLNLYRVMDLGEQRSNALAEAQYQQAEYQTITRSFPPSPARADRLKLTVEVAQRVAAQARLPERTFLVVSQVLDANPALTLTGLTWTHGRAPGQSEAAEQKFAQSARLQLELTAKPSEQKEVLAAIGKFVDELGKNEAVASARATKMPLNFASSAKLFGSTANPRQEQAQLVQFEVEVVLKPGV